MARGQREAAENSRWFVRPVRDCIERCCEAAMAVGTRRRGYSREYLMMLLGISLSLSLCLSAEQREGCSGKGGGHTQRAQVGS